MGLHRIADNEMGVAIDGKNIVSFNSSNVTFEENINMKKGLLLLDDAGTESITISSAPTVTTSYDIKHPPLEGTAGQVLAIASVSANVITAEWAANSGGGGVTYPLQGIAGSASAPTFSFDSGETDKGMYSGGSGILAFATNGTLSAHIDTIGNLNLASSNSLLLTDSGSNTITFSPPSTIVTSYETFAPTELVNNSNMQHTTSGELVWTPRPTYIADVAINGGGAAGVWSFGTTPNELANIKVVLWDTFYSSFFCALPSASNNGVWKSTDAQIYSQIATPSVGSGSHQIASDNNGNLMVAKGSAMIFSSNGTSFTTTTTSPPNTIRGLAHGNGTWTAAGINALYQSTDNGASWNSVLTMSGIGTNVEFAQFLNGGAGGFIVTLTSTGSSLDKVIVSNGASWNKLVTSSDTFITAADSTLGITISESLQRIVIGMNNSTTAIYIEDNVTPGTYLVNTCILNGGTPVTGALYGGAFGNGKFVISTGGTDTEYYESTDGITLTLKNDMTSNTETNGAYSPTLSTFVFGHNGGIVTQQMIYRIETAGSTVEMVLNNADYCTFANDQDNYFGYNGSGLSIVSNTQIDMDIGTNNILSTTSSKITANKPFVLVKMTTAERDALTPEQAMIIFNTTTLATETYNGTIWV
jgi:hypothetical protein